MIIEFICENCGIKKQREKRADSKFRFCSTRCAGKSAIQKANQRDRTRERNPFWKGGIRYALGYRFLLKPEHPFADKKGYMQEHRLVMEQFLGRILDPKEKVHHINGNKLDNRIENLALLFQNEHLKRHIEEGTINPAFWKGKKMSNETKRKMSETHKELWKKFGRRQHS